jgi:transposase-like protein
VSMRTALDDSVAVDLASSSREDSSGGRAMTLDFIAVLWAQEPQLSMSAIASELGLTRSSLARRIQRARKAGDLRFGPRPPGNQHSRNAESDRKLYRRRAAREPADGKVGSRGCRGACGRRKPS